MNSQTRWTGLTGLAGVLAIGVGMAIAAVTYEGTLGEPYRIANHFVSELGEIGVSQLAILFNGGLVAGGIGIVVFVIGLMRQINGWFRWIVAPVGIVTGVFGSLVGIFPMNNPAIHLFVANGFFYPGLTTMLLFSSYVILAPQRELPRWIAVPGLIAAGALFAFLFLGDAIENLLNGSDLRPDFGANRPTVWVSALFEWVDIGSVLAWIAAVATILLITNRMDRSY